MVGEKSNTLDIYDSICNPHWDSNYFLFVNCGIIAANKFNRGSMRSEIRSGWKGGFWAYSGTVNLSICVSGKAMLNLDQIGKYKHVDIRLFNNMNKIVWFLINRRIEKLITVMRSGLLLKYCLHCEKTNKQMAWYNKPITTFEFPPQFEKLD